MPVFEPEKSLLNPAFEGYKLDAIDQEETVARYPLPYTLKQSTIAGKSPLSFQEVQSMIRHNHLIVGPAGRSVYIDADLKVITIDLGAVSDLVYVLPDVHRADLLINNNYVSRDYHSKCCANCRNPCHHLRMPCTQSTPPPPSWILQPFLSPMVTACYMCYGSGMLVQPRS